MWSVVYCDCRGEVRSIGPVASRDLAERAAAEAIIGNQLDTQDTSVYLMSPDHELIQLPQPHDDWAKKVQ